MMKRRHLAILVGLTISVATSLPAQQTMTPLEAHELVSRTVHNELSGTAGLQYRFTLRKTDEKGETTKYIVETKDGDVARLVEVNNAPLTPDRAKQEQDRLNDLMAHPEVQAHRHQKEQEDSKRGDKMVRVLPDAFTYKLVGMAEQNGHPCYRLAFEPNPHFVPPDHESAVYHGMQGELWIDKEQERLVRMDAHLISDVDFGWGILGKLYKGGSIYVEQEDVGNQHWEQNHMKLNLNGMILMIKPLTIQTTEEELDFGEVPKTWTYQDAIRALEASPLPPQKSH
jgi:hypothetical protein